MFNFHFKELHIKFSDPLVILDCEMTGPDPTEHQLLEISALKCDPKNLGIIDRFHTNVGVPRGHNIEDVISRAHPGAMKKVNISSELLALSPSPENAITTLKEWLPSRKYIWVGHNLMLDFMFLRRACSPEVKFNYRFIDITTLIEIYIANNDIDLNDFSLRGLAEHLGLKLPSTNVHTAISDVYLVHKILELLILKIFNNQ